MLTAARPSAAGSGGRVRSPSGESLAAPDAPRGSHLEAPRPEAGGGLVPGLSSSSSSLSREGLRAAKNREKVCQGAPPLLRPPDIPSALWPVPGRLRGTGKAVSFAPSPARR